VNRRLGQSTSSSQPGDPEALSPTYAATFLFGQPRTAFFFFSLAAVVLA